MFFLFLLANLCERIHKKITGTSVCFKYVKRVKRERLTIYSAKLVNELYAYIRTEHN